MSNVSLSSTKQQTSRNVKKQRSFMSRLSTVLLPSHSKRSTKVKKVRQHSSNERNLETLQSSKEKFLDEEHEDEETHQNFDQGYATICDIIQADESSGESPPVPPKKFDALYSRVKKKRYSEVGCNTDDLAIVDNKLSSDYSANESINGTKNEQRENIEKSHAPPYKITEQTRNGIPAVRIEKTSIERTKSEKKKTARTIKKIMLRHQEELKYLKQDMQKMILKNENLQKQVMDLLERENLWKEEISSTMISQQEHLSMMVKNSELNDKITKLELETKQEVQLLCEKVKLIKNEKDHLLEELDVVSQENKELQQKCDQLIEERKSMISVKTHTKEIKNHQKVQQELKEKYENEIKEWMEKCNEIEGEKNSNSIKAQLLKEENKNLRTENSNLKNQQKQLIESNEQLSERLEKVIVSEREAYKLLAALQDTTKEVITERDILQKKSEFQDSQQSKLQTQFRDYFYELGRVEEHVSNVRQKLLSEVEVATARAQEAEMNYSTMKESYDRQLDILRTKIIEQKTFIDNLHDEKRKLELDFENLWQTVLQSKQDSGNTGVKIRTSQVTKEL